MNETNKKDDKSIWAIGGKLLISIGIGYFPWGKSISIRYMHTNWE